MLFDKVIAFDHLRQKIVLIVNMPLDDVEVRYNKAVMELKRLIELLRNGEKRGEPGGKLLGEVTSLFWQRTVLCHGGKGKTPYS
mgnify:CR=1 FL=1